MLKEVIKQKPKNNRKTSESRIKKFRRCKKEEYVGILVHTKS